MTAGEKKAAKKAAARSVSTADKLDGEAAVLTKIAAMPGAFRATGERLHALILRSAPALQPTMWYGMPGYATDGKVICFFCADKYMTFGLTDKANLAIENGAHHQFRESAWFFDAWTTPRRPSSAPSCARQRAKGGPQ